MKILRIYGACVFFLRVLAGKFKIFKHVIKMENFLKNRRMRIFSARIFLSLLAGKCGKIEQLFTTTIARQIIKYLFQLSMR